MSLFEKSVRDARSATNREKRRRDSDDRLRLESLPRLQSGDRRLQKEHR